MNWAVAPRAAAFFVCAEPFVAKLVRARNDGAQPLVKHPSNRGDVMEYRQMASERDEDQLGGTEDRSSNDRETTGQQGQQSEFGQDDGTSGQPIGGNDSATGTGTTLSQGADFNSKGSSGQSSSGQSQPSDSSADTLASDQGDSFGQGTTSNAGGSSVGTDQTSGGSSGTSGGEGFIGSQGGGSDDLIHGESSSGGSDFAKQGRGALDEDEDESGSSSEGSGGSGSSRGGSF